MFKSSFFSLGDGIMTNTTGFAEHSSWTGLSQRLVQLTVHILQEEGRRVSLRYFKRRTLELRAKYGGFIV